MPKRIFDSQELISPFPFFSHVCISVNMPKFILNPISRAKLVQFQSRFDADILTYGYQNVMYVFIL